MFEGQAYINLSIPLGAKIKTLTKSQCFDISELDSEKYRINMIKNKKNNENNCSHVWIWRRFKKAGYKNLNH